MRRPLKGGKISAGEAGERRERSRHWGWTALDPVRPGLRAMAGGPRPLELAPCVVPQVAQRGAPREGSDNLLNYHGQ